MLNGTRPSHHIPVWNAVPLKTDEECYVGLHCSPSQIPRLRSNGARQDFKGLVRETLDEFHFLSARQQRSSFAVIILGVVVEEEVTCLGNIGPLSAGSEVCVCVCVRKEGVEI